MDDMNKVATPVAEVAQSTNIFQDVANFMNDGGVFMWVIFALWCVGVVIAIERSKKMFYYDIDGASFMGQIRKYILNNQVTEAITLCANSNSLLAFVMKNGLKRVGQNREVIQDALDSSILEVIPKTEKRLNYLALIANLSTLFGLLGTIQGLIQSFGAVANADPASKAKLLAMGISTAMNTTALGLLAAISIMVIHSFLSSKSQKILGEVEEFSIKLIDLISHKNVASDKSEAA